MKPRKELVMLLEERTLSHFERRKRRMQRIPMSVVVSAITKGRKRGRTPGSNDRPLTREEWIVLYAGWVPEEREQLIQFMESRGYKRCRNCGLGVVHDGPYSRCAAGGSLHGDPQANPENTQL